MSETELVRARQVEPLSGPEHTSIRIPGFALSEGAEGQGNDAGVPLAGGAEERKKRRRKRKGRTQRMRERRRMEGSRTTNSQGSETGRDSAGTGEAGSSGRSSNLPHPESRSQLHRSGASRVITTEVADLMSGTALARICSISN